MHLALKSAAESGAQEAARVDKDRLAAWKMEKPSLLNVKVVEQQLPSRSAEAVTEVGSSAFVTHEMVRKFVMSQRRRVDQCNTMNPTR